MVPSSGKMAMPTLAWTVATPAVTSPTACRIRAASPCFPRASVSGARTQNSSPPIRATVSCARIERSSATATVRSRSSPAGWPKRSLRSLKPSRSSMTTAKLRLVRVWRAISYSARQTSDLRLAMPVRGSLRAKSRIASRSRPSLSRTAIRMAALESGTSSASTGEGSACRRIQATDGVTAATRTVTVARAPPVLVRVAAQARRTAGRQTQNAFPPPPTNTAATVIKAIATTRTGTGPRAGPPRRVAGGIATWTRPVGVITQVSSPSRTGRRSPFAAVKTRVAAIRMRAGARFRCASAMSSRLFLYFFRMPKARRRSSVSRAWLPPLAAGARGWILACR